MKCVLAVLALAVTLSLVAARAPLLNLNAKQIVPDQYLVVFHKNSSVQIRDFHVAELKSSRFVRKDFETIVNVFDIGNLIGYSAILDKRTLEQELNHPNIQYIEADQVVTIVEDSTRQTGATWGISRIDQVLPPAGTEYNYFNSAGSGVTAYIIDTGVLLTHTDFGGRAKWGNNQVPSEGETDGNGHGTHVAGTIGGGIYGVAKKVTIVAVKVLNSGGSGTWAGVIAGVDFVTKDHAARGANALSVANMSLGGGATPTLDTAVENSVAGGVNHVVAAGNSAADACGYSPARAPSAITVGATTSTDYRASYSNVGLCLDVFAPGDQITSTWIGSSNTATNTISGTSMASPHVAGAVAILLGHALAEGKTIPTPTDVDIAIKATATPGVIRDIGNNSPDRFLFSPYSDIQP